MDDLSEYRKMYEAESAEHLQAMNEALLALEKDPQNEEPINLMFRAAHTLKGMSATMGYSNIAELTHKMENLMDRVRKKETKLDARAIDTLFEGLDTLEKMAEDPENSSRCNISSLIQKILIITERERMVENNATIAPGNGYSTFEIKVTLHESCILKSARLNVVLRNLSELGEIRRTIPSAKDIEDEKFDRELRVTVSTKEDAKKLEDAVKRISEISKVEVVPADLQVDAQTAISMENCDPEKAKKTVKSVQSVRVNIERLDSLMNLVGELVINKIRLMQLASEYKFNVLEEALASLDRLTNELQEEVMASRMVPLEQIFNRFPRMVRDLAKKQGKEIEIIVEGSNIELDRTVLDEVGDPLVHILRNCVDHGIELPETREQHNKNIKGTIKLTARREKNYVIIEVQDDGKGMEPGKFREIAVKKGMMTEDDAAKLSDSDVLNFSFQPGFSTAEKITEISGRGVGMDVVKTKIEGMGGSVKLESRAGQGTTITLKLPLTVAIIHSQMVKVGKDIYAIPVTSVVSDLALKKNQIKTIQGEEVVLVRGEVLPLVRLQRLFGVLSNGSDDLIVVVVEHGGSNIGLVVDELIGQQEVIIKSLDNRILKGVKGFAGATILGDGNVALILDVGTLI